jgi:hypothetical protein
MKKYGLLILCIWIYANSFAQKNVIQLPVDSSYIPKNEHFIYFLPKTAFNIVVTVEKSQEIKGIYSDYAEKLLGISNVFKQTRTFFTLSKIEVNDVLIPDTNYQFIVELSKKQVKSDFYYQILMKNQMIKTENFPFLNSKSDPIPAFLKYYSDIKLLEKEESYVETKIIDGVLTQVPISKTKTITKSLDQQAQEAADFISKIRKDRYNVLTATHEVPFSKESLEYMISNLDLLEKNYLELFTGTILTVTESYEFIVIPDNETKLTIPIFAFSEQDGMLTLDAKNKDLIYMITLKPQIPIQNINSMEMKWTKNSSKKSGYIYREAVPYEIFVSNKNWGTRFFGIKPVYQFSLLRTLPIGSDTFMISKFAFIY